MFLVFCVAAVDFFNQINMLYGTITEFCTPTECKIMSAGPKYVFCLRDGRVVKINLVAVVMAVVSRYEYQWQDGNQYKKPTRVSAPEYVDFLMTWIQSQLDDETIFPSKIGKSTLHSSSISNTE